MCRLTGRPINFVNFAKGCELANIFIRLQLEGTKNCRLSQVQGLRFYCNLASLNWSSQPKFCHVFSYKANTVIPKKFEDNAMNYIPVIDFDECSIAKHEETICNESYEEVGSRLYEAFSNIGFAYLKNTGVLK